MKWFFIIVLAILWLNAPAVGFLGTILFFLYHFFKKSAQSGDEINPTQPRQSSNLTAGDLADLVLLRLELQSQLKEGRIDSEQHAQLIQRIDALCAEHLANFSAVPENNLWQKRRVIAWDLLNHHAELPLGQPPWHEEVAASQSNGWSTEFETPSTVSPLAIDKNTSAVLTEQTPETVNTIEAESPAQTVQSTIATETVTGYSSVEALHTESEQQAAIFAIDEEDHSPTLLHPIEQVNDSATQQQFSNPESTLNQYAWKPHEPTRLERALTTISGWHSMAVPFLVQNIGWFIGVFCFIAGSAFLVHSTTGYASNLIAFFAFFIFTLALLFGGYQLRSKRPELETSSYVIFILSVLLIPLTTITATQLLTSSDSIGLRILSSVLILVELGVFYFVVTLVSGLMDRSLQQGLPKFFIALTTTCTLQVLLLGVPFWQILVIIHLLIVAILSAGIYTYTTQWLQSIFIDQRKIAYFAAGTLVYAALVSFISISTRNTIILPDGYVGFFLMVLSGLLFFVDAQFKQWTQQYAHLSRFSFFVYGLSVLALCLVAQYQAASILTLILAIGLYGFIVWRYLTLTPLSIFLACCFWLYSLLVLQHLPEPLHLLASLPVLLVLHRIAHWALAKRESAYLALIVYRVLYSLLALLTVWSLAHSESGWLAMLTAITAGVLTYIALKSAPAALFSNDARQMENLNHYQNLLNSNWFYTLPLLGGVTVFYAPQMPVLSSEAQFSFGLLLLSGAWVYSGLLMFFSSTPSTTAKPIEQYLNSALLSMVVGLLPALVMPNTTRIGVLFGAGVILLWLSYKLLARWLFYTVFAVWGAGFALVKLTYFPDPSSGIVTVLLGIALWFWLWHVERQTHSDINQLKRDLATQKQALLPSCQVFGYYRLPSSAILFKEVISTPLEQLMVISWLLTMKAVIIRWLADTPCYSWLSAIFLMGLFSGLLIVRYHLIKLLPAPIMLVLAALLMLLQFIGLSPDNLLLFAVLFALAVWQWTVYSLNQPLFIKLINVLNPLFLQHESENITKITHHTAFLIILSSVILQLLNAESVHSLPIWLTLLTTTGFLWLSDRRYADVIVRYLVLGFSVLTAVELVALTVHPSFQWQALSTDVYAGLLLILLSFPLGALSTRITAYAKPAAITAMLLVFSSIFLQIDQVTNSVAIITMLDYSVLFLAGFSLLLANTKLKWTSCTTAAFIVLVLAVLWLENSVLHPYQAFSLWLGEPSSTHSWLVLGLLSLVLSLLSHNILTAQKWTIIYYSPLNTVTTVCFGSTLLNTLMLFLTTSGQAPLLSWLLLVLLLALFSVSKNWSNAAQLRSFASASLSTLMLFSVLPATLNSFLVQTVIVVFGYALWLCASFVLPRFNDRYANWTITPHFFPWLGFLLVAFSGYGRHFASEISLGIYCLELSIYCVLMRRYSQRLIFPWLATITFAAAVLWLENSLVHPHQPLSLWLGESTFSDSWLVLVLLSLTMSLLYHRLMSMEKWTVIYCSPLNTIANLCFGWALLGTLTLYFATAGHNNALPLLCACLLLALFSLSKNWSEAAQSRGFASACLPILAAFSLLPTPLDDSSLQTISVLFGYTLWLCASFIVPRFNKRYAEWTIEPLFFPWLGLLLVTLSNFWWQAVTEIDVGVYFLELSAYCLLMLRYSHWVMFAWCAAFTFTAAGVTFNIDNENLPINLLLWSNIQLLLVNFWQRKGETLAQRWQWQCSTLAQPFTFTATLVFVGYLLVGSLLWVVMLDDHSVQKDTLLISILLTLSFLHVLWLRFSTVVLHGFIYSVFLLLWSIYFTYLSKLFQPPLLLALWSMILLGIGYITQEYKSKIVLQNWLRLSVILATLALLSYTKDTLGELLLCLAIVAGLSTALAGRSIRSLWLVMAKIEGLLLLHGWPFLLVDVTHFYALLPWYALQSTVLATLSIWLLKRILAKPLAAEDMDYYTQALRGTLWLIMLGLVELSWHGILIQQSIVEGSSPNWLLPPFDALAALSTGFIISIIGVRHVRHQPDSNWLYGMVMLVSGLGFYSRLLLLGNAPVSLWDTSLLIVFAYGLFFSQRLFPSKPLLNMALLMPVLALFTVPLQLATPETSITLIMSSLLYAMMRRYTQQKIPLYLALLAFNGGVYLWVPSLVDSSRLIQVYVIPAALSILILLHLHNRELKPSVLMASRLAAISSIYACATVDVFLHAELGIFILAMVLSVAGILLGIALRTRAFLYAGVSFLLLNVLGQLIRFYPEQGLGKAIVLMVMGTIIIGTMIWFNMKRVAILQRINAIQVEMQSWE